MMVTGAFVVAEHDVAERAGLHQVGRRGRSAPAPGCISAEPGRPGCGERAPERQRAGAVQNSRRVIVKARLHMLRYVPRAPPVAPYRATLMWLALTTANVAMAPLPAKRPAHARLIAAPSRASACAQAARRRCRAGWRRCARSPRGRAPARLARLCPAPQRRLAQRKPPTACQPKKRLTRSSDDAGQMLDLDRGRALDPQHQRRRARRPRRPLPRGHCILIGSRMGGDLRADDLRPAGDELGRGEALLGEGVSSRHVAEQIGERARGCESCAGLFTAVALCHIGRP